MSYGLEGFRRGTFLCFRNVLVCRDFMDKRVVLQLSVEIVMSPSTQTFCRGTLLCSRLFPVSNIFKDKRGRGSYPKFLSCMFCLTVPKRFIADDIRNSPNICYRKMFGIRKGAAYHDSLSSKIFVRLYARIHLEKPSEFSIKLWYRKLFFSIIRGAELLSPLSVELFLSQNTKIFRRCPVLCFRKLLVSKCFMDEMGGELSRFFVETVFSHSTETFHRGTLLCFTKVLVSKNVWDKTRGAYCDSPCPIYETLRLTLIRKCLRRYFLNFQ